MLANTSFPRPGLLSKGILSRNYFVRTTAQKLDLNLALIKYPLIFLHEDFNLCSEHLARVTKSRLKPLAKSKLVTYLQVRICKLVLWKEKVHRFLDKLLPNKVRLTLITLLFGVAFTGLFLSSFTKFSKKYALYHLKEKHSMFRRYAFVGLSQDHYVKGLIVLNTGLYLMQTLCLFSIYTPSPHFKRGLDSATLGSTVALLSQIKLSDTVKRSQYGALVNKMQKAEVSLPFSACCAFAFYLSSKNTSSEAAAKLITKEMFLNEVTLLNQVKNSLPKLSKDLTKNLNLITGNFYANELNTLAYETCNSLKIEQYSPLYENKSVLCVHKAVLKYCKESKICKEVSKEAISTIQTLIQKGLVDVKNFQFGGPQNWYRDPHVTAISLINLYTADNNIFDDKGFVVEFAEIPQNYPLWTWLRAMKLFSDNSDL